MLDGTSFGTFLPGLLVCFRFRFRKRRSNIEIGDHWVQDWHRHGSYMFDTMRIQTSKIQRVSFFPFKKTRQELTEAFVFSIKDIDKGITLICKYSFTVTKFGIILAAQIWEIQFLSQQVGGGKISISLSQNVFFLSQNGGLLVLRGI